MSTITRAIKRLGIFKGLSSYWKLKRNKSTFHVAELDHPIQLRPHTSDGRIFRQIFYDGQYDIEPGFQPRYIIDAGANIGLFAVLAASRYKEARIICVEPDAANFQMLQRNTAPYPNITCVKSGIWNKEVILEVVDEGYGEWGMMVKEVETENENTIRAISIDQILSRYQMPYIDILKLDVEGAEASIFRDNYSEWLPKTRLLIIELHDYMLPESSKSFKEAIGRFNFSHFVSGENLCYVNLDFHQTAQQSDKD